jgi:uncharacterized membrane protein
MTKDNNNNRFLAASAFLFFIPSLYIILTGKRKNPALCRVSSEALLFWISGCFAIWLVRLFIMVTGLYFLAILKDLLKIVFLVLVVFLAAKAYQDKKHEIPYISSFVEKLC